MQLRSIFTALFSAGLIFAANPLHAEGGLESCRSSVGLSGPANEAPNKEVFILIDQTFLLDPVLKEEVLANVERLISPGNAYKVLVFSAFINNRYGTMKADGTLDQPIPENQRGSISVKKARLFDACLPQQTQVAKKKVREAIKAAFDESSTSIAKSEIFLSLNDFSDGVLRTSKAKEKIVFLVSDMLENSAITSFYAGKGIKQVVAAEEMKKVAAANVLGNFQGARIYVLGSGTIENAPKGGKDGQRTAKELLALKSFWEEYFKRSNGQLVKFGMPSLSGVQVE